MTASAAVAEPRMGPMLPAARIRRIQLANFRSYRSALVTIDRAVAVILGPNGAGKTNLLEAVSLLTPGRGLRRAPLQEIGCLAGDGTWSVSAEVEGASGVVMLGTGFDRRGGEETASRKCRIDGEGVASAAAFAEHLRIVWLLPAMDGLFAGRASERRRFLDRLVLAVDPAHGSRVAALEKSLRSRNRLLAEPRPNGSWLDAMEREAAALAVAVAAARTETVSRLSAALAMHRDPDSVFPWVEIALDGWIEGALAQQPATEVEDRYRAALKTGRTQDAAAGRTLIGPHLTDLAVVNGPNGLPAAKSSTGEQKAVLINLVLAHAELVAAMTGHAPVLLLDEVAAHLDPARRAALYQALVGLGAQVFLTGADPQAFADIASQADILRVSPGRILRPE